MTVKLFEPITLRGLEIPNRIFLPPMCQYVIDREDGVPTDWQFVHLGARATGGFGLLIAEACAIAPEGRISPRDAGLWNNEQAAAWARINDFVHSQGSKIGVQLNHAGRKASTYPALPGFPEGSIPTEEGGWVTQGPSADPMPGLDTPHEMTVDEIHAIPKLFAEAASRAVNAGFDLVEIHAAHGYLLHQFLSPLANKRTDEYGGSFENRIRIVVETIDAVRAVIPEEMPLFMRVSATDWIDDQPSWDLEQTVELSRVAKEHGVDLIDVSTGAVYPASIPVRPGYQVPFARTIRAEADIPVAAVGMLTDPQLDEFILEEGDADAIGVARGALMDPSWPLRAAHTLGVNLAEAGLSPQYARGTFR